MRGGTQEMTEGTTVRIGSGISSRNSSGSYSCEAHSISQSSPLENSGSWPQTLFSRNATKNCRRSNSSRCNRLTSSFNGGSAGAGISPYVTNGGGRTLIAVAVFVVPLPEFVAKPFDGLREGRELSAELRQRLGTVDVGRGNAACRRFGDQLAGCFRNHLL